MSREKKAEGKKNELKGKLKEATGRATDDESMAARGRADRTKGNLRQSAEKAKDAIKPDRT
ncbi:MULTISPECIES: CsbD family protein [Streptomycetaceae]|uniref:CsbD-like domain-containing protein n=1 Tax=Streptantibioticus cattleyicolor (strain ATCC 35852 / DSM 46488 / JCM 4925 / NBRC 14057 / NRRL 8057) TaxID=1003195 RepID=F8K1T8_STREN|nr:MULTISPECIES: CsbD family protein [Streptomycetaceae]AEW92407.1 hypothetical protein SCATT_00360 [Streptantibioticus cattleyicolor NRRL 8057 = DSM 46488]MYS57218.1 CsbD family protein [Streptomyces sp. SID5468]CCB72772.1 conserved protein of unknown function [Streptantibioticus cattleyicolor NRRL 8057 = DSM 46488]